MKGFSLSFPAFRPKSDCPETTVQEEKDPENDPEFFLHGIKAVAEQDPETKKEIEGNDKP